MSCRSRRSEAAYRGAQRSARRRREAALELTREQWLTGIRDELEAELARDQDQDRAARRARWLDSELRVLGTEAQQMLQRAADRRDEPKTIALRLAFLAAKHA